MWFRNGSNNYFYLQDDIEIDHGRRIVTKNNTINVFISREVDVFSMYGSQDIIWKLWWYKILKYDYKVDEAQHQKLNRLALKKILDGGRVGGYKHV